MTDAAPNPEGQRVVFLDIDGVLNRHGDPLPPFGWYQPARGNDGHWGLALPTDPTRKLASFLGVLDETLVSRARELVNQVGADIVIASGWRKFVPRPLLRDCLGDAGWSDAPIVGETPVLGPGWLSRPAEVEAWVRRHSPGAWVVIDDHAGYRQDCPHIKIDGQSGLAEADIERAVALMGQRASGWHW